MELGRILSNKRLYILFVVLVFLAGYFYMQGIDITGYEINSLWEDTEEDVDVSYYEDQRAFDREYKILMDEFAKATSKEAFLAQKEELRTKNLFFAQTRFLEIMMIENPENNALRQREEQIKELYESNDKFLDEYLAIRNQLTLDSIDALMLEWVVLNELFHQKAYVDSYRESIQKILENAENMLRSPVLSQKGFTRNNIMQAKEDFGGLENIQPTLVNGKAVASYMKTSFIDYPVLLLLIYVIFTFLAERKIGLWPIIHSTVKGRAPLAVRRIAIMLGFSIVAVFLFHGTIFVLAVLRHGSVTDIHAPVQSIEMFSRCTLHMSIMGFLLFYLLLKSLCMFVIAILIWAILSLIEQVVLGVLTTIGFIGIQYAVYAYIWPNSAIGFLKYLNIFSLLDIQKSTIPYINVNIFSHAVKLFHITLLYMTALLIAGILSSLLIAKIKKPIGNTIKEPAVFDTLFKKISIFFHTAQSSEWKYTNPSRCKEASLPFLLSYCCLSCSPIKTRFYTPKARPSKTLFTLNFMARFPKGKSRKSILYCPMKMPAIMCKKHLRELQNR
ncbi:MAG: hypothetical protein FWE59_04250 [Oscillospiraceae bacterium]|nr:hypothetical protein [Oscillospiraceae bacterium]